MNIQIKPEPVPQLIQGVVQIKNDKDNTEQVVTDHSYTEPPAKKVKTEDKRDVSVSSYYLLAPWTDYKAIIFSILFLEKMPKTPTLCINISTTTE